MEKRNLSIYYEQYTVAFPEKYTSLCQEAINARANSYSPYSDFSVGSAVLLENGTILCGANQENAAYPLGSCAERVALQQIAMYHPKIAVTAIAIAGGFESLSEAPVSPCGGCRQLFLEQIKKQGSDFDVVLCGINQTFVIKASALLPLSFIL